MATADDARMFRELAVYYDRLLGRKDTPAEVRLLERLVSRPGARSWLDVGCGTGRHLELLRHRYEVVGLDRSAAMLRIARRRLPGVRLVRGDMRAFYLGRAFDVVSCLYSGIGHLRSTREVGASFANFARHLRPGGVCLVEPWIDPADFRPGFVQLVVDPDPKEPIARMAVSARVGARSRVRYDYLIGNRRGVRHVRETVDGLLVRRAHLLALMRAAGLRATFLPRGLTPGRGLLVGRKPLGSPPFPVPPGPAGLSRGSINRT